LDLQVDGAHGVHLAVGLDKSACGDGDGSRIITLGRATSIDQLQYGPGTARP
jgi:hypothetical protein